jgi:glutamate synthase (NADPH/NADH) large chain
MATQIDAFYADLMDPEFASSVALVHQRYSTNTFPTWKLAHPYRYLAHNGEINTLRGNLNQERSREKLFKSELFGDELKECLPLFDAGLSDSGYLDNMLELLVLSGRSLPHAMLMIMPQAWGPKYHLGKDVRGFFEYHSALMEPMASMPVRCWIAMACVRPVIRSPATIFLCWPPRRACWIFRMTTWCGAAA